MLQHICLEPAAAAYRIAMATCLYALKFTTLDALREIGYLHEAIGTGG